MSRYWKSWDPQCVNDERESIGKQMESVVLSVGRTLTEQFKRNGCSDEQIRYLLPWIIKHQDSTLDHGDVYIVVDLKFFDGFAILLILRTSYAYEISPPAIISSVELEVVQDGKSRYIKGWRVESEALFPKSVPDRILAGHAGGIILRMSDGQQSEVRI